MPRARNIKPAIFKNELLGEADPLLTILFIGLWCLADKKGRLEDRPKRIKAELLPYREGINLNGYLTELERLGFISRYVVEDRPLIQISKFTEHQHPHHTEKDSLLPSISDATPDSIGSPVDNGGLTVKTPEPNSYAPSDSSNTDSSNTEVVVVVSTPKKPMEWVDYFVNKQGYTAAEAQTAKTIPMFDEWVKAEVTTDEVSQAMDIATAQLNEKPNGPKFLNNFVFDLRKSKDKQKPVGRAKSTPRNFEKTDYKAGASKYGFKTIETLPEPEAKA